MGIYYKYISIYITYRTIADGNLKLKRRALKKKKKNNHTELTIMFIK